MNAKLRRYFKNYLRQYWAITVGITTGVLGVSWVAMGATYNFYFNNTEQGPNSTASPSLSVSGDGMANGQKPTTLPNASPTPTAEASPAPEAAKPQAAAADQAGASVAAAPEPPSGKHWLIGAKMSLAFQTMGEKHADMSHEGPFANYGGVVGIGYQFTKDLGINAYGGGTRVNDAFPYRGTVHKPAFFAGGELEVMPVRISLGRFEDLLQFGAMIGASSFRRSEENIGSLHAGLRLNLNFGHGWGLSTAVRGNLGYLQSEAGLLIRL
ncbi:MAG: hypothetical protein A2583_01880 [Bdellovibrionales bacterium RIFOXYD1_FULL_53_11]|nr:MAG: hypothetical protein A2583_01880 [Bdellovibrionales bacterium RIFOXYD1_FULL_53_11]